MFRLVRLDSGGDVVDLDLIALMKLKEAKRRVIGDSASRRPHRSMKQRLLA
jgi:hypothetical protein